LVVGPTASRFTLKKLLGKGEFGWVWLVEQGGQTWALKVEYSPRHMSERTMLRNEAAAYTALSGVLGFPRMVWNGTLTQTLPVARGLVMTAGGPSMEKLHSQRGTFGLRDTLCFADQGLTRLQALHEAGWMHRDLKPENIVLDADVPRARALWILDFGISKQWRVRGKHIPITTGKPFSGTLRYASITNHNGVEQSRRDDIESLMYVIAWMAIGFLPWQSLRSGGMKERQKQQKVRDCKLQAEADMEKRCPAVILRILRAAKRLAFDEDPPYTRYRKWLHDAAREAGEPPLREGWSWQLSSSSSPSKSQHSRRPAPTTRGDRHGGAFAKPVTLGKRSYHEQHNDARSRDSRSSRSSRSPRRCSKRHAPSSSVYTRTRATTPTKSTKRRDQHTRASTRTRTRTRTRSGTETSAASRFTRRSRGTTSSGSWRRSRDSRDAESQSSYEEAHDDHSRQ
jgi:serine/threonine protein kinase